MLLDVVKGISGRAAWSASELWSGSKWWISHSWERSSAVMADFTFAIVSIGAIGR